MLPLGTAHSHPCAECGAKMVLRTSSRFGLFYGCARYPACQATHGAHADGTPLGIPANKATKLERIAAHELFDQLWEGPAAPMSRVEAYLWMQKMMGLSRTKAHIGCFMAEDCVRLRTLLLENFPDILGKPVQVPYDGPEERIP